MSRWPPEASNVVRRPRDDNRLPSPALAGPFHALMSRTGSFPLPLAYRLLRRYASARDQAILLDPFCGKGTALLAGRLLKLSVYGSDVAPEAVLCTTAKMLSVELDSITDYIRGLRLRPVSLRTVPNSVRTFFAPTTLQQIIALRDRLFHDMSEGNRTTRAHAIVALAALLGILHGRSRRSLSLPSAHAYSMAPEYARRFAQKHRLRRPRRNVKECLISKLESCLRAPILPDVRYSVRRGSALRCGRLFPGIRGKVDIILTSPPYLNAQTYAKDNWLRLWFLGYDHRSLQHDYIETGSVPRYENLMALVLRQMSLMLRPGGLLICVAGDVRLRSKRQSNGHSSVLRTGNLLARLIQRDDLGLRLMSIRRHMIPSNTRYFHALSASNGHTKHALVERVLVASRVK